MSHRPDIGTRGGVLTLGEILRFYLPLVLTSQMMTLSGPIINVGIGRSVDPTLDFAGYWLGFAVFLFLESPVLVIQQICATLITGYGSLKRLLLTSLMIGSFATVLILTVALTPIGEYLLAALIPTTERVLDLARTVMVIMSPIPLLVSVRGTANGLAIREKRTVLIARATFIRLLILSTIVGAAVLLQTGSGARAGATALVSGIAFETIIIVSAVIPFVKRRRREKRTDNPPLVFQTILKVASPLVVAAIVWTVSRPVVNSILGRLPDPELAQAGFGVIMPIALVTCSPLWAIHNVSLVLPETRRDLRSLIRFTAITALIFSTLIFILAVTPLRDLLLRRGFSLSPELEAQVAPAMILLIVEPVFLAARCFAQGLLMKAKRTEAMLVYSPIKIVLTAVVGFAAVASIPDANGALLGAALFIGGDMFEALTYGWKARSFTKSGVLFGPTDARLPEPDDAACEIS